MTLQLTHEPTTIQRPVGAPRRSKRWLVPAGLAVTAVVTFAVVDAVRDGGAGTAQRPAVAPAEATVDYTRSQRLIEQAITDARAGRTTVDYTRSQRLIEQAITDARAGRTTVDYTRSQRLVEHAIAEALAPR